MPKKIKVKAKKAEKERDFDIALRHYQSGSLRDAETACREILRQTPNNAYALHLLGRISGQTGRHDDAINYIGEAIKLNPDIPFYYNDIGNAFAEKGMKEEAEESYRKALMLNQDYAEAYSNLGLTLAEKGLLNDAIVNYRKAISLQPRNAVTYNNLGLALSAHGMKDEAIANYKKALELRPDFAEAYFNLGMALKESGMAEEAVEYYRNAIKLRPDNAAAYNCMGNILAQKGSTDQALEYYGKALELSPDYADAYNNLGNALADKGLLDEAAENYKTALKLKPDFAKPYYNLGNLLRDKGDAIEAIEHYNKAIGLKPDYAEAHNSLGMAYLLAKDFERGWEEYEWRLNVNQKTAPPMSRPKWDGTSLKERTILVYSEQGYGDILQFVRYLPALYDGFGAKKVLFVPYGGLEQLLRESDLKAEILDAGISADSLEYDTNIHLLSLPRIFKTNLENMPFKQKRYLKANPEKVKWYREKFFDLIRCTLNATRFNIGIIWQGNPAFGYASKKAIPLNNFYPLCRLSGIRLYSLQKGYGMEQLQNRPDDMKIINLGETFNDFSDTAAAIENMDMVISIDSSGAHLSGALGKKTWILHPPFAEWRWHLDMDYSPWYEDVRLFRHKEPGKKDWDEMMERVKEQVEVEIKNR